MLDMEFRTRKIEEKNGVLLILASLKIHIFLCLENWPETKTIKYHRSDRKSLMKIKL